METTVLEHYKLRDYQEDIQRQILRRIKTKNFIVTMMPTGSGKTILQISLAKKFINEGKNVLVLEPTRFLTDQMQKKWEKEFTGILSKKYEGECGEEHKQLYLSTPKTALKCLEKWPSFNIIIIDEFHRVPTSKYYTQLLMNVINKDTVLLGFTALVSSRKLIRLHSKIRELIGEPYVLKYDFKDLSRYGDYVPPNSIADLYDSELEENEKGFYQKLITRAPPDDLRLHRLYSMAASYCYRYGINTACKFIEKHNISEELVSECHASNMKSHKIRVLDEILATYNIDDVAPIIIFAWSRTFIRELYNHLIENHGINKDEIRVITGETKRSERLRILEELRGGGIKIIISSSVGEEGFDLPDAGLLILVDVPSNETRFYQRLGRLLRKNPKHRIKYLAIISTPYTPEYELLPEVLFRLELEGVDISYVLAGLEELIQRTPAKAVAQAVKEYCDEMNVTSIPYLTLKWGWEKTIVKDTVNSFLEQSKEVSEELSEILGMILLPTMDTKGLEYKDLLLYFYASKKVLEKWDPDKFAVRKQYKNYEFYKDKLVSIGKRMNNLLTRGSIYRNLKKTIENGQVYLAPNPDMLSELLYPVYQLVGRHWSPTIKPRPPAFEIKEKYIVLLTANIVAEEYLHDYIRLLENEKNHYLTLLDELIEEKELENSFAYKLTPVYSHCIDKICVLHIDEPKELSKHNKPARMRVNYYITYFTRENRNYMLYKEAIIQSLDLAGYKLLLRNLDSGQI